MRGTAPAAWMSGSRGQADSRRERKVEVIRTERLILRPFRTSDQADLSEFLSQLKEDEFEGYPDLTPERGREQLQRRLGPEEFLAVEIPSEGKVIGNLYCGRRPYGAREVGFIIHEK